MEFKKLEWLEMQKRFVTGKDAYVGPIKVGSVHYNSIDRDDSLRYVANSTLPELNKRVLGKYPTEEEAMKKVETMTGQWLASLTTSLDQ